MSSTTDKSPQSAKATAADNGGAGEKAPSQAAPTTQSATKAANEASQEASQQDPGAPYYDNPNRKDRREDPTAKPCRDWLMGVCDRIKCQFFHPPMNADEAADYIFCQDYVRGGCSVLSCRLIHAAGDIIGRYRQSGNVDIPLARAIAALQPMNSMGVGKGKINGVPLCGEYQEWGRCTRPVHCRYWHVSVREEKLKRETEIRLMATGIASNDITPQMMAAMRKKMVASGYGWGGEDGLGGSRHYPEGPAGAGPGGSFGFFNSTGDSFGDGMPPRAKRAAMMPPMMGGRGEYVPEIADLYSTADSMTATRQLRGASSFDPRMRQMTTAALVRASLNPYEEFENAAGSIYQSGADENTATLLKQQTMRIMELERANVELVTEVTGLKRELKREKNRYDDLVYLFRTTAGPLSNSVPTSNTSSSGTINRRGMASTGTYDAWRPVSSALSPELPAGGGGGTSMGGGTTWAANSVDEARYNWGTMAATSSAQQPGSATANAAGSTATGQAKTPGMVSAAGVKDTVSAMVERRMAEYYAAVGSGNGGGAKNPY